MEFHGNPCPDTPWNSMEKFQRIPWNSMEFHGNPRPNTPWNSMEFHGGILHGPPGEKRPCSEWWSQNFKVHKVKKKPNVVANSVSSTKSL